MSETAQAPAVNRKKPLLTASGVLKITEPDEWNGKMSYKHLIEQEGSIYSSQIVIVASFALSQADLDNGVPVKWSYERDKMVHYRMIEK